MSRYLPLSIVLLILILLNGLAASRAPARANETADFTQRVKNQQQKIKRVQKGIEDHKDLVRHSRVVETNLFEQLEIIDQAIENGRRKLTELKIKTAEQEELIAQKTLEVAEKISEKDAVKEHVKKRLAAFYRMGDIGFMNVTFSASSLPDLLNFNEYFTSLIKYDQKIIIDYRLKIEGLIRAKTVQEEEQAALLDGIAAIENQEKQLAAVRKERVALLAKVNTEKELYRRALEEMEKASANLTETLAELREKLVASQKAQKHFYSSPKKRRPGSVKDFFAMKGKLIPPVRGSVTTYFGKNKQGKFGITTDAAGIDIKTISGSEIRAIYNGKVVYAGQLKGYGNLVIIDHDNQYYSLISRAAELYKKEGDIVSTGEAIGIMTENGGLLGEGLHLEIRHGTEPEDPLDWVNKKLLNLGPSFAVIQPTKKTSKNN